MLLDPLLNSIGFPDLAHAEHGHGSGEVGPRRESLHALTTDVEARSDLAAPIRWCMVANIVNMLLVA